MTASSGEPTTSGLPVYNMQDCFDVPINLPQISSKELIGLTFLDKTGTGEHARAKIVKKILDNDAANHKQIKMLISYDDSRIKELITHELCDLVAKQHNCEVKGEQEPFTFQHIIDHQGPLKKGNEDYNRSCYNIKIEWGDAGVMMWEPLTVMGTCQGRWFTQ